MRRALEQLRRRAPAPDELERCPECRKDFVTPADWEERDGCRWWMRLRCGECGDVREVVVPDATAQRYDLVLNRATDAIAATWRRLERERMAAEAEAFATALRLDLLDADDFAPRSA